MEEKYMITTANKEYAKVLKWIVNHRETDIVTIITADSIREYEKLRLLNLIIPVDKFEQHRDPYTMRTISRIKIRDTNLAITFNIGHYDGKITNLYVEEINRELFYSFHK
jgi:hypothetical protein